MPYNQNLAERIRTFLGTRTGLIEKKMFGGVGFLLHGNMACGVLGDDLIVRVSAKDYDSALSKPFVRPFMMTGRKPMQGWIFVAPEGWIPDQALRQWIDMGCEYVMTLPKKN